MPEPKKKPARITASAFYVTCHCGEEIAEPLTGSFIWSPNDFSHVGEPRTTKCPACETVLVLALPAKVKT